MTPEMMKQRLQELRGLFAAMERGEDPDGYTPALDQAIAELTAPTGEHRPIQDVSGPIPPDPAAPSAAFHVGVNEADETDPHLRMLTAPSSPSVEQMKLLHITRMMALTKEPSAIKVQAAGESLDALIATVRAERAQGELDLDKLANSCRNGGLHYCPNCDNNFATIISLNRRETRPLGGDRSPSRTHPQRGIAMTAPSFTVATIEQALEQGLAVITLMQLRDALQSGQVAIVTKEAQRQPFVNIRNRVKAIRDTAILPDRERPRDFNIGWQLGRLIDDIENSAGLRSSWRKPPPSNAVSMQRANRRQREARR